MLGDAVDSAEMREAAELAYWFGQRPVRAVVRQGRIAEGSL